MQEVKKTELWLMVGLPRAGKTTLAKEISKKHMAPIVCPDGVRLALHGHDYIQSAEEMVWTIAHLMVKALFYSGHDRVIVDATNISKKRRRSWRGDYWNCCFIEVNTDLETCLERADYNPNLVDAIKRMHGNRESISPDEGRVLNLEDLLK